jgi:hypothetical protein
MSDDPKTVTWRQRVTAEPLALPHDFGRYRLDACLGRGGMGVVYKAHDTLLDRIVALKVPREGIGAPPEVRHIFLRESKIGARLATLQTLSICHVFDAGEIDGCPFFTMEYLPGHNLDAYWLEEGARLGRVGVADVVQKIARVMHRVHGLTLHDETIVHRDLKPSNVLLVPINGDPVPRLVLLDFGIALTVRADQSSAPAQADSAGTFGYMPPEQMEPGWQGTTITPRSDVYALGAILYQLLTGQVPFPPTDFPKLKHAVLTGDFRVPGRINPLHEPFDEVCRRALARHPNDRYATMAEFADALNVLYLEFQVIRPVSPTAEGQVMESHARPLVPTGAIKFAFVPFGFTAPAALVGQDRLFLDVGNRLAAGVIDHHHLRGADGPTVRLVRDRAELIDAAVNPARAADKPFTIVLHQNPDLDAVVSAALAVGYLATRDFPPHIDALIRYVDRSDSGESCVSLEKPFTLYSAFQRIAARSIAAGDSPEERWRATVRDGIALVKYVLGEIERTGAPIEEIDPFQSQLISPADCASVLADADRYRAKLAAPATQARRCRLRLKGRSGGEVGVEGLVVRNVQNTSDPARCTYFKDWARSDTNGSRDGRGFAALSVFMPEEAGSPRRCILSVTPGCGASLEGLGKLLDEAESARRENVLGADDRKTDPATGSVLVPRPGYDSADPWYDGRSHDYTIVDAPRSGTLLTADEIEGIFLTFGNAAEVEGLAEVKRN